MTNIRPAIYTLVTLTLLGGVVIWVASHDPEWLAAHSPSHWPVAVQVVVGVIVGAFLLVGLGFWAIVLWGIAVSVKDGVKHARANHRFANESTADRIIVARYNTDGDRDVVLDVPLTEKRLWLAPSTEPLSGGEYVALLDHAPLYRRSESEIGLPYECPTLDWAHKPLWTGSSFDRSKRATAEREAIDAAIDAGAVTLHVTPDGWEPAIPADAKFRTLWALERTQPAAA
ncbi:hypothetical protein ACWGJ9_09855 [Curtobacterium citreum]